MITFHSIFKHKIPYHEKCYHAVVKHDGSVRDLRRKFRTATRAEVYGHAVIQRYERLLVGASGAGDLERQASGAGGNTVESGAGGPMSTP